mgnify:CR=1 FL=1
MRQTASAGYARTLQQCVSLAALMLGMGEGVAVYAHPSQPAHAPQQSGQQQKSTAANNAPTSNTGTSTIGAPPVGASEGEGTRPSATNGEQLLESSRGVSSSAPSQRTRSRTEDRLPSPLSRLQANLGGTLPSAGEAAFYVDGEPPRERFDLSGTVDFIAGYNSNYTLASDGADVGSAVGSVLPTLTLTALGRESFIRAQYGLQAHYFEDADDTDTRHTVRLDSALTLLSRRLVLRANADISQRFLGQGTQLTDSDQNLSPFRRTVQSYAAGPTYQDRIGDFARFEASYRFGLQRTSLVANDPNLPGVSFSDSNSHRAAVGVTGAVPGTKLGWEARSSLFIVERDNDETRERSESVFGIAYELAKGVRIVGEGGYFSSDADTLFDSGAVWRAGVVLEGRYLDLTFKGGQRSGQTNFEGDLSYKLTQRLRLTARWQDGLDTSQSVQSTLLFESEGLSLEGDLTQVESLGFDFTNRLFRRQRGDVGVRWEGTRFSLDGRVYYEERNFDDDQSSTSNEGFTLRGRYQYGEGHTLAASFEARRSDFSQSLAREDDLYRVSLTYTRPVNDYLDLVGSFNFADRSSTLDTFDATEAVGSVVLRLRF